MARLILLTGELPSPELSPPPGTSPPEALAEVVKTGPMEFLQNLWQTTPWAFYAAAAVLVLLLGLVIFLLVRGRKKKSAPEITLSPAPLDQKTLLVANIHHIGNRESQQDSFGVSGLSDRALVAQKGLLAVVADGMGGLSGGAEVSAIVSSFMLGRFQNAPLEDDPADLLLQMVNGANAEVGGYLAQKGGQSGSTVVAVIIKDDLLHFVSVGDSRIYLLRGGALTALNREHTYGNELDERAARGEISLSEAKNDPQRAALTSYIGMPGSLLIDRSLKPVPLVMGDHILLMSDGVFGTLTDEEIVSAFLGGDIYEAALRLEALVLGKQKQGQDNFTSVIIRVGEK